MKKAGIYTIAVLVLAALAVFVYKFQQSQNDMTPKTKGTLVKEYKEWKKYYI